MACWPELLAPIASAPMPDAVELLPMAMASILDAVEFGPIDVAFVPPTAEALGPQAILPKLPPSSAPALPPAGLVTLSQVKACAGTGVSTVPAAVMAKTLIANAQLPSSADRRLCKTLVDGHGDIGWATWTGTASDNDIPFAPACAALLRCDFMFNPVQHGTGEAQPIFFSRLDTSSAPRPSQTPVSRTTQTRPERCGAGPAPAPGRLVGFPSGKCVLAATLQGIAVPAQAIHFHAVAEADDAVRQAAARIRFTSGGTASSVSAARAASSGITVCFSEPRRRIETWRVSASLRPTTSSTGTFASECSRTL